MIHRRAFTGAVGDIRHGGGPASSARELVNTHLTVETGAATHSAHQGGCLSGDDTPVSSDKYRLVVPIGIGRRINRDESAS